MKKLYRIKAKGKIAGICAGIADMYDWDPTLVRLAFVFVGVLTSVFPAIATYLVGWWLVPEKADVE